MLIKICETTNYKASMFRLRALAFNNEFVYFQIEQLFLNSVGPSISLGKDNFINPVLNQRVRHRKKVILTGADSGFQQGGGDKNFRNKHIIEI